MSRFRQIGRRDYIITMLSCKQLLCKQQMLYSGFLILLNYTRNRTCFLTFSILSFWLSFLRNMFQIALWKQIFWTNGFFFSRSLIILDRGKHILPAKKHWSPSLSMTDLTRKNKNWATKSNLSSFHIFYSHPQEVNRKVWK